MKTHFDGVISSEYELDIDYHEGNPVSIEDVVSKLSV